MAMLYKTRVLAQANAAGCDVDQCVRCRRWGVGGVVVDRDGLCPVCRSEDVEPASAEQLTACLRANLSPEAVALVAASLEPAAVAPVGCEDDEAIDAAGQVEWFRGVLISLVGSDAVEAAGEDLRRR